MVQLNPIVILKIIFIECHHFGRKLILHSFLVMRTFKVHSLSNFEIPNRVLLTRVTVLCICTLHFAPLPSPYLWGPPVCYCLFFFLFCIYEYVSLFFFFWFHISFGISVSLISLCIMPSGSTHVLTNVKTAFFWYG